MTLISRGSSNLLMRTYSNKSEILRAILISPSIVISPLINAIDVLSSFFINFSKFELLILIEQSDLRSKLFISILSLVSSTKTTPSSNSNFNLESSFLFFLELILLKKELFHLISSFTQFYFIKTWPPFASYI